MNLRKRADTFRTAPDLRRGRNQGPPQRQESRLKGAAQGRTRPRCRVPRHWRCYREPGPVCANTSLPAGVRDPAKHARMDPHSLECQRQSCTDRSLAERHATRAQRHSRQSSSSPSRAGARCRAASNAMPSRRRRLRARSPRACSARASAAPLSWRRSATRSRYTRSSRR